MHFPGKWVLEILVTLGCLVNLWMDVEAFRCIQLNQDPTLDSEPHECVTLPLVWSRDPVLWGARTAGLGEAGRPGFFALFCPFLVHLLLESKLIQNSWNSLELNKIWMEHNVKLMLFPRSWRLRMWIYGRQQWVSFKTFQRWKPKSSNRGGGPNESIPSPKS